MPKTKCASIRAASQVTSQTQYPPNVVRGSTDILPSFHNMNFFGKDFMDSLLNFMQHSHNFLQNWKQEAGHQQYMMSDQERQYKVNQITSLISQKEKELSELQSMKSQLTNIDTYSTFSNVTTDFGASLRSASQQQNYNNYSTITYPYEPYEEDQSVVDAQYSTAPEYSEFETQTAPAPESRSQYSTAGYANDSDYDTMDDGAMKYCRTQ